MRLTQRLFLGSLLVVAIFVIVVVVRLDRRLRSRLQDDAAQNLMREARLVATIWRENPDQDAFADSVGAATRNRITLIDSTGRVVGDSEFDLPALAALENHRTRPEVADAFRSGTGTSLRASASAGDVELYAAVRSAMGIARVSANAESIDTLVASVRRDVLSVAVLAGLIAVLLSAYFARTLAAPIEALRDDARALAAGDLARRPSLNASGEVGELASALHRMAEQLSARLEAQEADEVLLTALSESLNEGIIAVNARQQVVRINSNARRMLVVREQVPFSADILPRERILREALTAALRGEPTDALETTVGDRTLALTARPLAAGGAVLALFDLTPVRRLELVRRDFVANVSHELRTPLTVVSGFAETLGDLDLPADRRTQFLDAIVVNTRRMQRIVDDLLDLSRIESGGWVPNPTSLDVQLYAYDALATVRDAADAKKVELRSEISGDALKVDADPTALRQILGNLVDNAVRHTASGSITVFASREGEHIAIGVRDTGAGIPADHLPRIFERFYRVDSARSRDAGGTGLGLAIVKHMVEAHGGRVRAESAVGQGTSITATFPPRPSVTDA